MKLREKAGIPNRPSREVLVVEDEAGDERVFQPRRDMAPEMWSAFDDYVAGDKPCRIRESAWLVKLGVLEPSGRLALSKKAQLAENIKNDSRNFLFAFGRSSVPRSPAGLLHHLSQSIQVFPELERELKRPLENLSRLIQGEDLHGGPGELVLLRLGESRSRCAVDAISVLPQHKNRVMSDLQGAGWPEVKLRQIRLLPKVSLPGKAPVEILRIFEEAAMLGVLFPQTKRELLGYLSPYWEEARLALDRAYTDYVAKTIHIDQYIDRAVALTILASPEARLDSTGSIFIRPRTAKPLSNFQPLPQRPTF